MKNITCSNSTKQFKPGDIVRCKRAVEDFPISHLGSKIYSKGYFVTALIIRYINGFDSGMHMGFEARVLSDDAKVLPHFTPYFIPMANIGEYTLEKTDKTIKQQEIE